MVIQTNPPKKKKHFDEVLTVETYTEPQAPPKPKCHYCGCEYAITGSCRFCTQCSKPIPHYQECEPDQVYQGKSERKLRKFFRDLKSLVIFK